MVLNLLFIVLLLFLHGNSESNDSQNIDKRYIYHGVTGQSPYFDRLTEEENLALQISCGLRPARMEKLAEPKLMIENGYYVARGDYPWAASLSASDMETLNNRCGATLISPRHLVTATHCFFDYSDKSIPCAGPTLKSDFDNLKISFGGICLRSSSEHFCKNRDIQTIKVRRVAILSAFNDGLCFGGNDFSIIELENDVKFDSNVQPICLMSGRQKDSIKKQKEDLFRRISNSVSIGWGMDYTGVFSARLRHFSTNISVDTNIRDRTDVINSYSTKQNYKEKKYANICSGDSGAGLVGIDSKTKRHVLIGIHSYASGCTNKGLYNDQYSSTMINAHLEEICLITGICPPGVSTDY